MQENPGPSRSKFYPCQHWDKSNPKARQAVGVPSLLFTTESHRMRYATHPASEVHLPLRRNGWAKLGCIKTHGTVH